MVFLFLFLYVPEAAGVEVADGLLACAWLSVGVPPDAKKNFVFRVLSRLVICLLYTSDAADE